MRGLRRLAIGIAAPAMIVGTMAAAPSAMAAPPSGCQSNPVASKVRTNGALAIPLALMCQSGGASPVSVSIVTPPAHGTLAGPLESPVYMPSPGFAGSDQLTFRVTNPDGSSGDLSWSFDVADGVGYAPQCSGTAPPYVRNDAPVSISLSCFNQQVDETRVVVVTPPQHGTLSPVQPSAFEPVASSLMPNTSVSRSTVTYTADPGYTGPDTFQIAGDDGHQVGTPQSVMVKVTDGAINHPPICSATPNFTVGADVTTMLLASCADPDGDPITVTTPQPPAHGQIGEWALGQYFGYGAGYTPNAGFTGADAITVQATDARGASSSPAPMNLTVQGEAPSTTILCAKRMLAVTRNVPLTALGPPCFTATGTPATVSITVAPSHGTASITPAGELRYVPDRNYIGPDTMALHAAFGSVTLDAPVVVTVRSKAKATILSGPPASSPDTTQTFSLYAESGVMLTCALSDSPSATPAPCSGTRTYTDTPAGDHVLTVTATDDQGRVSTDTYAFTVTATTPPPSGGSTGGGGGTSGGSSGGAGASAGKTGPMANAPSQAPTDPPAPAIAPTPNAPSAPAAPPAAAPSDPLAKVAAARLPLASLRTDGHATLTFSAPSRGRLSARWTIADPRGLGRRIVVATATARASGPGVVKVTVRLTRAGRDLLRRDRRSVRVSARVTFRPDGAAATTRSATVNLR